MEMTIPNDFKESLELLNSHKVEFIIVGAYALALHGLPRFTGALDLFIKPDKENACHLLAAIREFGFESLVLTEKDFTEADQVIQLGRPPVRVDLLTGLTAITWEKAAAGKRPGRLGNVQVFFLGRQQLLENKQALGRTKDLADIENLERKDI